MSADPIIQDPYHSQAFNRYSYVWNNPLNAVDPTGNIGEILRDGCNPFLQKPECFGALNFLNFGRGREASRVKENGQGMRTVVIEPAPTSDRAGPSGSAQSIVNSANTHPNANAQAQSSTTSTPKSPTFKRLKNTGAIPIPGSQEEAEAFATDDAIDEIMRTYAPQMAGSKNPTDSAIGRELLAKQNDITFHWDQTENNKPVNRCSERLNPIACTEASVAAGANVNFWHSSAMGDLLQGKVLESSYGGHITSFRQLVAHEIGHTLNRNIHMQTAANRAKIAGAANFLELQDAYEFDADLTGAIIMKWLNGNGQ
jgi:hypothetical protein